MRLDTSQMKLCGLVMTEVPETLLKFFENEQHARCFVRGEIRLGLLDYYRTVEGARKDESEGLVSFCWNQKAPQVSIGIITGKIVGHGQSDENIHYSGFSANPYFLLCTSHPQADRKALGRKFGKFIVRINDPLALLERIKVAWRNNPWSLNGSAFIAPVVYNKDGLLEPDPYLRAPTSYSYSQKSKSFEEEREFRYVLECSIQARIEVKETVTLSLPDCSDICSPLEAANDA